LLRHLQVSEQAARSPNTATTPAEAAHAQQINAGETIYVGNGRELHVLDLVPVEEEDSPYVGLLRMEPEQ
jgi:hypothetical protein